MDQLEHREIPGLPGYRASSDGRIWSEWQPGGQGKQARRSGQWKPLAASLDEAGRPRVCLKGNRKFRVCRLVLMAFVGDQPDLDACHGDGNPSNNAIENLRWGTPRENAADRRQHGRDRLGIAHHNAKLSNADVKSMRELRSLGNSLQNIALRFGVSTTQVHNVTKLKHWKEVV